MQSREGGAVMGPILAIPKEAWIWWSLAAVAHTHRGRARAEGYALEYIRKANQEWWPTVEA
jgi:hypothetical protein